MPEFTLSRQEAIEETRTALAGLEQDLIPDETIEQSVFLFSKPWVEKEISSGESSEIYEAAVIAYAAELSFSAWFSKSRMRDRELEVFTEPRVWRADLKQRTNEVFSTAGITRPPRHLHYTEVAKPPEDTRAENAEE